MNSQIAEQVLRVVNAVLFAEKKRVFEFKGARLYPSEVHLLLVIRNELNTNATQIARKLGVTKGAVSQTLSRLEKKGIVLKAKDPANKNELTLSLTRLGREACAHCQRVQDAFLTAHTKYLRKLDADDKAAVLGFLRHMEQSFGETDPP